MGCERLSTLLLIKKSLKRHREDPLFHRDPLTNQRDITRILFVALLEVGILYLEEKPMIRRVRGECAGLCKDHLRRGPMIIKLHDHQILHEITVPSSHEDSAIRKLIHHFVRLKHRGRIARGDPEQGSHHRVLGTRRDIGIDPETDSDKKKRHGQNRDENPRKTHPVGTQGDDFIIRRESSKNQQNSREKTPRDREGHRKRKDKGDESQHTLKWHAVIDQQIKHLLENIPKNQHQTQQRNAH